MFHTSPSSYAVCTNTLGLICASLKFLAKALQTHFFPRLLAVRSKQLGRPRVPRVCRIRPPHAGHMVLLEGKRCFAFFHMPVICH